MPERFSYKCKAEPSGSTSWSTLSAPMGDGYVQRAANGINTRRDTWNLTARGMVGLPSVCSRGQDIEGIVAFIERHEGYKSFEWTAPDGTDALWYCESVSKLKETKHVMSLTFTFLRTYAP